MSDEVTITAETDLKLRFHSPEFDNKGWMETYVLSAAAPDFSASIKVYNLPYGTHPNDYFEQLSKELKGWNGQKDWGTIEGEYSLSARFKTIGLILLEVFLHSPNGDWTSTITMPIEPGQLENISKKLKTFFQPCG